MWYGRNAKKPAQSQSETDWVQSQTTRADGVKVTICKPFTREHYEEKEEARRRLRKSRAL